MRRLKSTGFYPDEKQDNSLQFELDIKGFERNEAVAQTDRIKAIGRY
ncbi:hypothetical protein PS943_00244 [Pseudomonas fluorescens]|uniref:Uncharacterized protein n=1 Tax=Pseudomonas fluorescens TaxID=294 RepID=A0A5E7VWE7_PSEFL|nr:pyocin S6 family toxin immunity protein [Pseudomonas fluorescens]VVQ27178.1 hypothetical protein PS943_00244 [Pseudomonas fluorescens]